MGAGSSRGARPAGPAGSRPPQAPPPLPGAQYAQAAAMAAAAATQQQLYGRAAFAAAGPPQTYGQFYSGQSPAGQYPYPPPRYAPAAPPPAPEPAAQRTTTIRNDVNLKKPTLKLVPVPESPGTLKLTFSFDASAPCWVSVLYCATEDAAKACKLTQARGVPAARVAFDQGLGQKFETSLEGALSIAKFSAAELSQDTGDRFPLVVRLETITKEGREAGRSLGAVPGDALPAWVQAQTTYATLKKRDDGSWAPRVLKQKIWVEGVSYELQEIYGIEQATGAATTSDGEPSKGGEMDGLGDGKECVICMSECRDTTVLPCRHMCLCYACAKVLRHQSNKCPICRTQVESLLQITITRSDAVATTGA